MLKQKYKLQKMIRKYYTIRENRYYLTEETRGWKKGGGDLFDVAMGAYDGAKVSELVGTFLLEKISEICEILWNKLVK